MGRKKKVSSFIDNEKYFSKHSGLKENDEIVYKRLSDDQMSLGTIKWFEVTRDGNILVSVIDKVIKSFQTCYLSDIDLEPSKKLVEKLKKKSS